MARMISEVAQEIIKVWQRPSPAAVPYIEAMLHIHGDVDTRYYAEDGRMIVSYFLSNAAAFRGDDAKRIKAELKAMVGA